MYVRYKRLIYGTEGLYIGIKLGGGDDLRRRKGGKEAREVKVRK